MTAAVAASLLAAAAAASEPRVIRKEVVVEARLAEVWRLWTTTKGAEEFFAPKANIEARAGGPYELYFDPKDERQSSAGMKVLGAQKLRMISFQWNAPPDMPTVRKEGTWVVVRMKAHGDGRVTVTLTHHGWKDGPEWAKAHAFFFKAWDAVLERFARRVKSGPVDWSKEG